MRKNLADYPMLVAEWHLTKNINKMSDYSYRCWWICPKGHEYTALCKDRIRGRGCPYCAGKKVCIDNCLQTRFPEVAKDWHPTKNGNLTPKDIVGRTNKKYWWLCPEGHESEISCSLKVEYSLNCNGNGCPYCSGKKASSDNCLAALFPEVAKEWHPTKNRVTPADVVAHSHTPYWWICPKKHEFKTSPHQKLQTKYGCPYCTGKKSCPENCLATLFQNIAKEWHPTKNGQLTPTDIVAHSHTKYWWVCPKGHEYETTPHGRLRPSKGKGNGCPYCSGNKVCIDNCLATRFPHLVTDWHPTKNGKLTPIDVVAHTITKVWWICKNNHEWQASCGDRASGNGCPICKESKGEKKITNYLTENHYIFIRQVRFPGCKHISFLPFDFLVRMPQEDVLIEYQGKQHYFPGGFGASKEKGEVEFVKIKTRDSTKAQWCKDNNIKLLVIPYWEYNNIDTILEVSL